MCVGQTRLSSCSLKSNPMGIICLLIWFAYEAAWRGKTGCSKLAFGMQIARTKYQGMYGPLGHQNELHSNFLFSNG